MSREKMIDWLISECIRIGREFGSHPKSERCALDAIIIAQVAKAVLNPDGYPLGDLRELAKKWPDDEYAQGVIQRADWTGMIRDESFVYEGKK